MSKIDPLVVYQSGLFRDCVSAMLRQVGVAEPVTLALTELAADSIRKTEAVIVEVQRQGADWEKVIDLVSERNGHPGRLLVLAVSFADDEMQVLASQRVCGADAAHLLGVLKAWSGAADR